MQAGGALLFIVAFLGWYSKFTTDLEQNFHEICDNGLPFYLSFLVTFVIMAAEMRLPLNLWVGDLSHLWPSTNVPVTEGEKED